MNFLAFYIHAQKTNKQFMKALNLPNLFFLVSMIRTEAATLITDKEYKHTL